MIGEKSQRYMAAQSMALAAAVALEPFGFLSLDLAIATVPWPSTVLGLSSLT